jgi:endonuclease/exonuclease/phosphatase family metal-dependent hydrolase
MARFFLAALAAAAAISVAASAEGGEAPPVPRARLAPPRILSARAVAAALARGERIAA